MSDVTGEQADSRSGELLDSFERGPIVKLPQPTFQMIDSAGTLCQASFSIAPDGTIMQGTSDLAAITVSRTKEVVSKVRPDEPVRQVVISGDDDGEPPSGLALMKFHSLMRGRYWIAILLSLLLAGGGGYAGFRLGGKTYQSNGLLRVMTVVPKVMYSVDEKGTIPNIESFMDAQVALLRSQRVVDLAMQSPEWVNLKRDRSDASVLEFIDNLAISRRGEMLYIQATDNDPNAAMSAVKATVGAYLKLYEEQDANSGEKRRQILEDRQTTLTNQLGAIRQRINAITRGGNSLDARAEMRVEEVFELDRKISELELELASFTAAPLPDPAAVDSLTVEDIAAESQQVAQLLAERKKLERDIEMLRRLRGAMDNDPEVKAKTFLLQAAENDLQSAVARYKELRKKGLNAVAGGQGATEASLREKLRIYKDQRAIAQTELNTLSQQQQQVSELRTEEEATRQKLEETRRRIEQLSLESRITGRIEVVSDGDRPLTHHKDTRITYAAAGGMGGVMLGFGLVIGFALLDRRVRAPIDLQLSAGEVPILGMLPRLPEDLSKPEQIVMTSHCVQEIRTLLQIWHKGPGCRSFAVTSAVAGSGKTSLTLALGVSFASSRMRTLLVDCDLVGGGLTSRVNAMVRRRIGRILEREGLVSRKDVSLALKTAKSSGRRLGEVLVEGGYISQADLDRVISAQEAEPVGLMDALVGENLDACIAPTGVDDLHILPLGAATRRSVPRLSPESMHELIRRAGQRFDIILIDTGPIPGSLEASVAASQVDGVVLLVSKNEPQPLVRKAKEQVESVRGRLAGLVFNRATESDLERYSGSYKSMSSHRISVQQYADDDDSMDVRLGHFGPMAAAVASYSEPEKKNGTPHTAD